MRVVLFLILFYVFVFAGDESRIATEFPYYIQAEIIRSNNSLGFSNMFKADAAELAGGNPAAVCNFENIATGITFELRSSIEMFSDIYIEQDKIWKPISAAFIFPYKDFKLALTYQNSKNYAIDFGYIPITTIEDPEGIGNSFRPVFTSNVYDLGFVLGKKLEKLFTKEDRVSFGIKLNLDYLSHYEEIYNAKMEVNDVATSFNVGIIYDYNSMFGLSASYVYSPTFIKDYSIDSGILENPEEDLVNTDSTRIRIYATNKYTFKSVFADRINIAMRINPIQELAIILNFEEVLYSQINSAFKNVINYSLGAIYNTPYRFDVALGAYQSALETNSTSNDALFLGFGLRKKFNFGDMYWNVYDSNLYSDKTRKQTILKFGLNYSFN